jgi:hypothetical protein
MADHSMFTILFRKWRQVNHVYKDMSVKDDFPTTSNNAPVVIAHPDLESATLVFLPTLTEAAAPTNSQTSSEAESLPRPSSPHTNEQPTSPTAEPEILPSISLVAKTTTLTTVVGLGDEVQTITGTLNYYSTLTLTTSPRTSNELSISSSISSLVHPPFV